MVASLNQSFTCADGNHESSTSDILKALGIIIIMILIITGNVICLIVLNMPKTRKHFVNRVRYTMNSLCCTDLSMGLFVCPSTIYPALYQCWPFGETFCKVEALLLSALFFESTANMILIATDRYLIIRHTTRYKTVMTSQRYLFVILCSWVIVFSTCGGFIFAGDQFYFDRIGINCEPYYDNPDVTYTIISLFYLLPVVIFAFSYGSIYRTAVTRKFLSISSDDKTARLVNTNIKTAKYLAAITFGFLIAVSPWNVCTIIKTASKIQINETADYIITWLGISNSFWNSLIYGMMNKKFRKAAAHTACYTLICSKRVAGNTSKSDDGTRMSDRPNS